MNNMLVIPSVKAVADPGFPRREGANHKGEVPTYYIRPVLFIVKTIPGKRSFYLFFERFIAKKE